MHEDGGAEPGGQHQLRYPIKKGGEIHTGAQSRPRKVIGQQPRRGKHADDPRGLADRDHNEQSTNDDVKIMDTPFRGSASRHRKFQQLGCTKVPGTSSGAQRGADHTPRKGRCAAGCEFARWLAGLAVTPESALVPQHRASGGESGVAVTTV